MAAVSTAIVAGMGLASAYSQSAALGIQSEYETQQAESNSKLLAIKEKEALNAGDKDAAKLKRQAASIQGSQRASLAASGVVVNYGSGQDVVDETGLFASNDAAKIKNNAFLEAWGYKTESQNITGKAKMGAIAAKGQQFATLLGGAGKSFEAFSGSAPQTSGGGYFSK